MRFDNISDADLEAEYKRRQNVKNREIEIASVRMKVKSPIGIWHFTTEGDCEGRSTKDLGIHEGHVGEIALKLASLAFYSINAKPIAKEPDKVPKQDQAPLTYYDFVGNAFNLEKDVAAPAIAKWLGEGWEAVPGQYSNSVTIRKR